MKERLLKLVFKPDQLATLEAIDAVFQHLRKHRHVVTPLDVLATMKQDGVDTGLGEKELLKLIDRGLYGGKLSWDLCPLTASATCLVDCYSSVELWTYGRGMSDWTSQICRVGEINGLSFDKCSDFTPHHIHAAVLRQAPNLQKHRVMILYGSHGKSADKMAVCLKQFRAALKERMARWWYNDQCGCEVWQPDGLWVPMRRRLRGRYHRLVESAYDQAEQRLKDLVMVDLGYEVANLVQDLSKANHLMSLPSNAVVSSIRDLHRRGCSRYEKGRLPESIS